MCMCQKSNINGQPGYCWNNQNEVGTRPVSPPTLQDDDVLIFDEPGRCEKGKGDAHSHHFRVVSKGCFYWLLVRHGGGDERIPIRECAIPAMMLSTSYGRYWMLYTIYAAHRDARILGHKNERAIWTAAAAEKRIKTRKHRGTGEVRVWIDPTKAEVETILL